MRFLRNFQKFRKNLDFFSIENPIEVSSSKTIQPINIRSGITVARLEKSQGSPLAQQATPARDSETRPTPARDSKNHKNLFRNVLRCPKSIFLWCRLRHKSPKLDFSGFLLDFQRISFDFKGFYDFLDLQ